MSRSHPSAMHSQHTCRFPYAWCPVHEPALILLHSTPTRTYTASALQNDRLRWTPIFNVCCPHWPALLPFSDPDEFAAPVLETKMSDTTTGLAAKSSIAANRKASNTRNNANVQYVQHSFARMELARSMNGESQSKAHRTQRHSIAEHLSLARL